jgi:hypothetical protein
MHWVAKQVFGQLYGAYGPIVAAIQAYAVQRAVSRAH